MNTDAFNFAFNSRQTYLLCLQCQNTCAFCIFGWLLLYVGIQIEYKELL